MSVYNKSDSEYWGNLVKYKRLYFSDLSRVNGARLEHFHLLVDVGRVDPVQLVLRLLSRHQLAQGRQPLVLVKGIAMRRCRRGHFHVRARSGGFSA